MKWTGYIRIECEGGFPERFLNEAAARGVELWDISRAEISLFCCCFPTAYRALRSAARAASVRMRVRERHGLCFVLRPFRLRWGLPIGAMVFVLCLQLLASRVWTVHIMGNQRVAEDEIRRTLQPLGVHEGASMKAVDLPTVQLTALQQLPELVWLTVNFEGSTAVVEVKERQATPPMTENTPANIVAARDGLIVSVDAVTGEAAVKVGDAVVEGTLLISGVMDSKVGPLLKRAEGRVVARTVRNVTVEVPFVEQVPSLHPHTIVRPCLYVLGFRIPLYTNAQVVGEYTVNTEKKPLKAYGRALPIGLEIERLIFETTETHRRSVQQAKEEAKVRLQAQVAAWGDEVTIENVQYTERETDTGWYLSGVYTCLESIGRLESLELHD